MGVLIKIASEDELKYAKQLADEYRESAQTRGTGIAMRRPEYLENKMRNGNAVIALDQGKLAGFCYIEIFSSEQYVSNSGLIVVPDYRGLGLSRQIKKAAFNLAREKYPEAKIFGITTSSIVMKINSDLGYKPVSLSELTTDDEFWNACSSCSNFDILTRHQRKMCLCTGMLAASKNEMEHDLSKMILDQSKK